MIGVSCTDFCSRAPEEIWEEVSKEFSHWEIFSEAKHAIGGFLERFLEKKDSYDMSYSVHAPICEVNIASLNERMREAAVIDIVVTMEVAAAMGAQTVTVHPGVYSMAVGGMKARAEDLARLSLKTVSRAAKEYGVTVAVENMPSIPVMMGRTPEELGALVEGMDLGICFDIGHANTMGNIDEFLDRFEGKIANVHIHDNNGDRDAHLTMGEGSIDFRPVVSKLSGYRGNYVIESKSLESAVKSTTALEALL
ncbi:MAG: sugar phosphate isomerase/epimerase [Candidatus Methanoplasma sp.]|jgi:sugar phosphate isomerase/epimerase|nr:sugar phosphate isomerase/epimerase [Candidatus Methanoplasma sp.]